VSEPKYQIVMPQQKVRCTLAQKDKGEPYAVEITMSPKVKFKDGKATEATVNNWGPASAPLPAGQRVRHEEMCRAQGRAPGRQTQLAACSKRLNQAS
jgi:hypothetical protein